jgi:hypothetical protein
MSMTSQGALFPESQGYIFQNQNMEKLTPNGRVVVAAFRFKHMDRSCRCVLRKGYSKSDDDRYIHPIHTHPTRYSSAATKTTVQVVIAKDQARTTGSTVVKNCWS